MNPKAVQSSLLVLVLLLGAAGSGRAQEIEPGDSPADSAFQPPRGESRRFDPPADPEGETPAPISAPQAPPPAPPSARPSAWPGEAGEDRRPQAWDRYGRPREVPPPVARPDVRPDVQPDEGRTGADRRDDGRRRDDRHRDDDEDRWDRGDRRDRHEGWNRRDRWDRWDRYGKYDWHWSHYPPPPPRYDPRGYPPVWVPPLRYRGEPWAPPPGFVPRRWTYGEVLPWPWWTPRHRIETWWVYGLPVPPVGFSWVRLGRDAVLVDLWTGRVVQVAFSLFW